VGPVFFSHVEGFVFGVIFLSFNQAFGDELHVSPVSPTKKIVLRFCFALAPVMGRLVFPLWGWGRFAVPSSIFVGLSPLFFMVPVFLTLVGLRFNPSETISFPFSHSPCCKRKSA